MGLNSCLIFLGDAAVFLQISFGASEARECHGFSAREIGFVFFPKDGYTISSIFVLEEIFYFA